MVIITKERITTKSVDPLDIDGDVNIMWYYAGHSQLRKRYNRCHDGYVSGVISSSDEKFLKQFNKIPGSIADVTKKVHGKLHKIIEQGDSNPSKIAKKEGMGIWWEDEGVWE